MSQLSGLGFPELAVSAATRTDKPVRGRSCEGREDCDGEVAALLLLLLCFL